jgi:cytochrome bd ubiquinol oxidase subunit II
VAFAAGSLLAALAQGFLLGAFVQGVELEEGAFAGSAFDWLTPFSALTALALVAGYALLGATWLVLKTEDGLQEWSRVVARPLALVVLILLATVSMITPALDATIAERWFGGGKLVWLWPIPLASAAVGYALWRSLLEAYERAPFLLTIGVFLLGYLGLAVSLWPNIIPPSVSIWQAAAPPSSQEFVLAVVAFTMPAVLAYTWLAYRVFRGKVQPAGGYDGHD